MDTYWFGMPSEPIGVSSCEKLYSKPSFQDAHFIHNTSETKVSINL